MKSDSRLNYLWRKLSVALVAAMLLSSSGLALQAQGTAAKPAAALSAAESQAAAQLKTATIREVTTALSSSEMQGRGTGTPGGEKAARYIADRFAKLGLKPLGDSGTYLQAVSFKATQIMPETSIKAGDATLKFGKDFIIAPPFRTDLPQVTSNVVFVGYGVISEALKRNDYEGLDLKGKIVVLLSGSPKHVDAETWKKNAPQQSIFMALLSRAPAALIITGPDDEQQPFSMISDYLTRRSVALASAPQPPMKLPPIMIASIEGAEKLFAGTGATFADTLKKAEAGEMVSRELNKQATVAIQLKQEEVIGSNVVAVLEGADAALKDQAVLYSAHYDAYGMGADGRIYPGAADNALGVAEILAIAEAFAKSPARPRRSVIFLAVTGEEHGLLGAEHWAAHPTWPLDKIVANINYDGIGTEVYGPVKRLVGFGAEYSDLGALFESVVAATGGSVVADPMPEEKAFYRSDHYAFVKKGVPALMLMGMPEGDMEAIKQRVRAWLKADYHQPTDTVRADWNWEGARKVAEVGLILGMRVAAADAAPAWLPSAPFKRRAANAAPGR